MAEESLKLTHLMAVLQEYGQLVRDKYKENLVKSDALATEELYNTVEFDVIANDVRVEVVMHLADHWKYSEFDTRPHWAPVQSLKDWVRVKGIEFEERDINRAAYAIRWKIAHEGTEGTHDLEDALKEIDAVYTERIVAALQQDLGESVEYVLYRSFNKRV